MDKGFFVVLVSCKGVRTEVGIKGVKHWKANLVNPVYGWIKTSGETIEETLASQKEQYDDRIATDQMVPDLVTIASGPMASGQTVRFVSVS